MSSLSGCCFCYVIFLSCAALFFCYVTLLCQRLYVMSYTCRVSMDSDITNHIRRTAGPILEKSENEHLPFLDAPRQQLPYMVTNRDITKTPLWTADITKTLFRTAHITNIYLLKLRHTNSDTPPPVSSAEDCAASLHCNAFKVCADTSLTLSTR